MFAYKKERRWKNLRCLAGVVAALALTAATSPASAQAAAAYQTPPSSSGSTEVPEWAKVRISDLEQSADRRKAVGNAFLVVGTLSAITVLAAGIQLGAGDNCFEEVGCNTKRDAFLLVVGGLTSLVTLPTGFALRDSGIRKQQEANELRARLSFAPTMARNGFGGGIASLSVDF